MRLKIVIGFLVLAIVTGACGVATPVLSSGPSLAYQPDVSPAESASASTAENLADAAVVIPEGALPPQGLDVAAGYPFTMNSSSPRYLPAFTQPDAGCAWVGVAGQILDQDGAPLEGVVVLVKGYFNNKLLDLQTLSGLQKAYGESGFEVQIGDQAADTHNALTIQLVNSKFEALSDVYALSTFNDCQRNLILINFQAASDSWKAYMP